MQSAWPEPNQAARLGSRCLDSSDGRLRIRRESEFHPEGEARASSAPALGSRCLDSSDGRLRVRRECEFHPEGEARASSAPVRQGRDIAPPPPLPPEFLQRGPKDHEAQTNAMMEEMRQVVSAHQRKLKRQNTASTLQQALFMHKQRTGLTAHEATCVKADSSGQTGEGTGASSSPGLHTKRNKAEKVRKARFLGRRGRLASRETSTMLERAVASLS